MLVSDWMTRQTITIEESEMIPRAIELMKEHKIRRLPAVRADELVGIITDRDMREYMPSKATDLEAHELRYLIDKTPVSSVMCRNVLTISPETPLEQAAAIMRREKIGGMPVMEYGKLVAVITESDIFEALVELLGADEPGGRITLELGASAGALNDILNLIKEVSPKVTCALTYTKEELPTSRNLVLKLRVSLDEYEALVVRLEDQGLTVTDARFTGN